MRSILHSTAAFAILLSLVTSPATVPSAQAEDDVLAVADVKHEGPVDFEKEILPILRRNCLACHNATDAESEMVLETPQKILAGGASGEVVAPESPEDSLLFMLVTHESEPVMPPKDNDVGAKSLSPQELGLLKLWIQEGAQGEVAGSLGPQWQQLPPGVNPVYSVAVSPDGQYAAAGRANQVFVYQVPGKTELGRLTDPSLLQADVADKPGVAHLDLVQSLCFGPDGLRLVSGGFRTAKVWRRPENVRVSDLAGLTSAPQAAAASSDGKTVALGEENGKIHLFEAASGKLLRSLEGHSAAVTGIRFNGDGSKLYSTSKDKSLRVWNVAEGTALSRVDAPSALNDLTLIGEGPQVATAGEDNVIRLWNLAAASWQLPSLPAPVVRLVSSADGKWLAAALEDGKVAVVDVAGKQVVATVAGHAEGVSDLQLNASGNRLVTVGADQQVRLWNLPAGEPIVAVPVPEPPSEIVSSQVAVHPSGNLIAVGGASGAIRVLKIDTPAARALNEANGAPVEVAATSQDATLLATVGVADDKPVIFVRDLASGNVLQKLTGHEGKITSLALSTDKSHLISGSEDKTARIWTLSDGKQVASLTELPAAVVGVALNSNGQQAVTATADQAVAIWNVGDGKKIHDLAGHEPAVTSVVFAPNNQSVLTGSADNKVRVFNPADGKLARTIDATAAVHDLAVTSDSARVAVATADKHVRLFQIGDGNATVTVGPLNEAAQSVDFSSDNSRVLAAGTSVLVADSASGTILERLEGSATFAAFALDPQQAIVSRPDQKLEVLALRYQHSAGEQQEPITGLTYAVDGSGLFSASEDGTVRRFEANNGQEQFSANHGVPIRSLAISPDGQWLASGGDDKQIKVWNAGNGAAAPKPQLGGFAGAVTGVAFSANSEKVAGADAEANQTLVFHLGEGTLDELQPTAAPASSVAAVAHGEATQLVLSLGNKSTRVLPLLAGAKVTGHSQPVLSLATVNETQFISGSADGTVRHWETSNGQQVRQMNHGGPVEAVAVRPGGASFASASANHTAKIWNASNGQQIAELKGSYQAKLFEEELTRSVALAKRKVDLANGDLKTAQDRKKSEEENLKKAMEAKTKAEEEYNKKVEAAKKPVAEKEAADKELAAAEKTATEAEKVKTDAEAAVKASEEAVTKAQEALKAAEKTLQDATTAATQAAEKAKQAAEAADKDKENKDVAAAKEAAEKAAAEAEEARKKAEQAKVDAEKTVADATAKKKTDDEALAAANKELETAQNNVKQAEAQVKKTEGPAEKAVDERTAAERTFKASERSVVRAGEAVEKAEKKIPEVEATVKELETVHTQREEDLEKAKTAYAETEKPLLGLAYSPDGSVLATGGEGQQVQTWDAETGAAIASLNGHAAAIHALTFVNDRQLLSAAADNTAIVWDTNPDWQLERVIGNTDDPSILVDRVTALDISPDGRFLATGSGEPSRSGQLKIWDLETGELVREIEEAHSDTIFGLEFSRDGDQIASCGADRFIKIFNVADGKFVRAFEGHTHHVLDVSWSADGRSLASSGADQVIKIWNVLTGDQTRTISGFSKELTSIEFVSDGNNVAASSGDSNVHIRRSDNGGNVRSLGGAADYVYSVDVSADGKTIIAGGQDSVVRVWNDEGQALATFEPPAPPETPETPEAEETAKQASE